MKQIKFTKRGRPTAHQEKQIREIEDLISNLPEHEQPKYLTDKYTPRDIDEKLNFLKELSSEPFVIEVTNAEPTKPDGIIGVPTSNEYEESPQESVNEEPKNTNSETESEGDSISTDNTDPSPNNFEPELEEKEPSPHVAETPTPSTEPVDEIIEEPEIVITPEPKPIPKQESINSNKDMSTHEIEDAKIVEETTGAPTKFWSPLHDPVKKRSYNEIQHDSAIGDIPEPDFKPPPEPIDSSTVASDGTQESPDPKIINRLTNPQMSELDEKDQDLASAQLAKTLLGAYEMAHTIGAEFVKIPEKKLTKLVQEGKIDPTLRLGTASGESFNLHEFAQDYNRDVATTISYDEEWGKKIEPTLTRVLKKKGMGVTDEQFLLIEVGKDVATKLMLVRQLKQTSKEILGTFVQMSNTHGTPVSEPLKPDSVEYPDNGGNASAGTTPDPNVSTSESEVVFDITEDADAPTAEEIELKLED